MMKKLVTILVAAAALTIGASVAYAEEYVSVKVNGEYMITDVLPRIENSRTIVPIRFVSESLGFKVDWKDETKEVTISKGDKNIKLTLDSNKAYVNNKEYTLDMPAVERDNRTMVPLRFISENLNCTVDWFEREQLVCVNAFRQDGYPVALFTRLYQSGEYTVGDNYGKRFLTKEGLKFSLIEIGEPNSTGVGYNGTNLDASIMIDEITPATRDAVKDILKIVMPKDYEMAYMYLITTIRREAFEGFAEDSFTPMVQGYLEGRNITTQVGLNNYTSALVTITYPQTDIGIRGLRRKTVLPDEPMNESTSYFVELYSVYEYTKADYDALRKPIFMKMLNKYYEIDWNGQYHERKVPLAD